MNTNTPRTDEIGEPGTSKIRRLRELADNELDAVTGGLVVNAIIAILIGQLTPEPQPIFERHVCRAT